MKIRETDWGIASRVGDTIYLNKALQHNTILKSAILKHELGHKDKYSKEDLLHDIHFDDLRNLRRDYYSFILRNPRTWTEFLPFSFYDKKLQVNISLLIFYGFLMILAGVLLR